MCIICRNSLNQQRPVCRKDVQHAQCAMCIFGSCALVTLISEMEIADAIPWVAAVEGNKRVACAAIDKAARADLQLRETDQVGRLNRRRGFES